MQTPFGIIIAIVLLGCAYSALVPQQPFDLDLLQAEAQFLVSLTPEQRGLWGKIKDKVTGAAINVGVGALVGLVGKRDVSEQEIESFLVSLTPEQRGLWGKIKDKLTSVAISTAVGALIGKK